MQQQAMRARKGVFAGAVAAALAATLMIPSLAYADPTASETQAEAQAALASLNILALYGDEHRAQENYDWNAAAGPASSCVACGACEDVCPQRIGIVRELVRAAGLFEKR